jgi:hypothetical protein
MILRTGDGNRTRLICLEDRGVTTTLHRHDLLTSETSWADAWIMSLIRTSRPLRTLVQGFAVDIAIATVLVLVTAFDDIEWTPKYWIALGLTVAKSVLQAGAAYWMRTLVKPAEDPKE